MILRRATPALGLVVLALGACGGDGAKTPTPQPKPAGAASAGREATECGTYSGRGCAPEAKRVDLARPAFSNPTKITNKLFPISNLHSALLLGHVDGKPFRTETTLLPGTRTVTWDGERIPVRVSQYMAYLDGRLEEVALDRYAQADDGSVWYLGEDVFDYEKGTVALTEGTWLAGRDGPAAMIMPASPKVGDVFRPENVPGIVWEEVSVESVDETVDGPRGPVSGALVTSELHTDGSREKKVFAPGYGEFRTAGGGDLEAIALAVPTDALPGSVPPELSSLSTGAGGMLELARLEDWEAAAAMLARVDAAWEALRGREQPPMIAERLDADLDALHRSLKKRDAAGLAQESIDVGQSALDLQLRHRPPPEIDRERLHLWTQQLRVDAAAKDLDGVEGAVAALEWTWQRIASGVRPEDNRDIDARLRALRGATDARNLPAAADHAARLGARIRSAEKT